MRKLSIEIMEKKSRDYAMDQFIGTSFERALTDEITRMNESVPTLFTTPSIVFSIFKCR